MTTSQLKKNPAKEQVQSKPEVQSRDELFLGLAEFFKGLMAISESEGLNNLAEEDLTFTQIRTLLVASAGEQLAITRVAEVLGMSATAASRGVDHLVHLGLLERRTSEADRRVKLVSITPKGTSLINSHREAKERALRLLVDSLPAEHIEALNDSLQPIISDPEFIGRTSSAFCR